MNDYQVIIIGGAPGVIDADEEHRAAQRRAAAGSGAASEGVTSARKLSRK